MTSSSSALPVVVAPVFSVSLSSDLYQPDKALSQNLHPFLSVTQRGGELVFAIACIGSRYDDMSPSRVMILGCAVDAVHLKLEEHVELRRLYDVIVPLDDTQEIECIKIIELRARISSVKFEEAQSGVHRTIEVNGAAIEPTGKTFVVDVEKNELVMKLPSPNYLRS